MWDERIAQVQASGVDSLADAAMGRWFTDEFRKAHPDVVAIHRRMLSETPATDMPRPAPPFATPICGPR